MNPILILQQGTYEEADVYDLPFCSCPVSHALLHLCERASERADSQAAAAAAAAMHETTDCTEWSKAAW
jgi:hypothetical protein